jgi:hypothetical protein
LIRHLPPESAVKTELRNAMSDAEIKRLAEEADPSQGQWSHTEMLIASLIDAVRTNTFVLQRVNGVKVKAPEPIPRPGVPSKKRKKRRQLTPEQTALVLARIRGERVPLGRGMWVQSPPGLVTRPVR